MKTLEIYKITNNINNKIYVGITNQGYKTRWYKHCSDSIRECGFPLHLAMRKHGIANFIIEIIDTANTIEELKEKEKYWIKTLASNNRQIGYNLTEGGDGTFGRKTSEETKEKISNSIKYSERSDDFKIWKTINNPNNKSVKQFDLNDKLIKEYISAKQASRELNINARCISKCASSINKTYKGFKWEYSEPKEYIKQIYNNPNKIKKEKYHPTEEVKQRISETNKLRWTEERHLKQSLNNPKNRPILQYTLNGEFIKEFYNVSQVVKELGLTTHTNVAKCARNERKKAAGYIWKYK